MIVFKIILIYLFISMYQCRVPDKVYCVNQHCSEPISKAKTLINYNSADQDLISFRANADAQIYMKSAGDNPELWYAKINDKAGFVNSQFLKEIKIIEKNPSFVVPFDVKIHQDVQPAKVQQPHEVFEGTTIFNTEVSTPSTQDSSTIAPTTESVENSTPTLIEVPQDSAHLSDNSVQYVQNDVHNNDNDHPVLSNSEEAQNIWQENDNPEIKTGMPQLENILKNPEENNVNNASNDQRSDNIQINTDHHTTTPDTHESLPLPHISTSANNENVIPSKIDHLQQNIPNIETTNTNELNTLAKSNTQPPFETSSETDMSGQESYVPPSLNNENIQLPQVPEIPITSQYENDLLNNVNVVNTNTQQNVRDVQVADTLTAQQGSETIPAAVIDTQSFPSSTETIPADNIQVTETLTDINSLTSTDSTPISIPETTQISTETSEESTNFHEQFTVTTTPQQTSSGLHQELTQSVPEESSSTTEYYIPTSTEPFVEDISTTEIPYSQNANEEAMSSETYSTTEDPKNDDGNGNGLLSDMYSTLADMWPSTTEAPEPEKIFNPEFMHKDEPKDTTADEGFSIIAYFIDTYKSVMGSREESRALFATPGETCYTDEYCDGESMENKNRLLTFLVTTAVSVLLFTLGYYYIDNKRQDSRLIGTINSLQRDLLFSTKECEILREELTSTKNKLAGIEDSSFGMDDMVQSLKEEIEELKAQNERLRKSLDDNEKLLRVSENTASELQNTLGEVENTLSELFAERANTEEQIVELNGKVQAFEEELISVSRDRDNFQLKYVSAEFALEETKRQKKQLEELNQKLNEAKNAIELQKHEIVALKDVIKDLKSGAPSDVDVNSLIDHTEIKAKLSKVTEEKDTYMSKYEVEHKERSRLTEELTVTKEALQTTTQQATEAITRLEVLEKYFQERESELMKELNTKESLWLSKQGESASTVEKMTILQQEAQRYKEKCDALTLELAEQESMRRTAISEAEARAHGAWLEARQARREADAARDEAAALRRKLASLHHADGAVSPHRPVASPMEAVENNVFPPPMLPLSFLPPPILPPLPRPPPLGRLPSPHPPRYSERRYSPDSRYSPISRFSPESNYPLEAEARDYSPTSRFSPLPYAPDAGRADGPPYAPRSPRSPRSPRDRYSPRRRRHRDRSRSRSRERYSEGREGRNGLDTEPEYNSGSPARRSRRRARYSRPNSGPSSISTCSSESDK